MSALRYIARHVVPTAIALLDEVAEDIHHPAERLLDSPAARAMLLAIGLQESNFQHRRQIRGPALSFWQAESTGGFRGTLTHPKTGALALAVLERMGYGAPDQTDFQALEDNDILACCGARLLLWSHPQPLPKVADVGPAWRYYMDTWRPGKPHPDKWPTVYKQAWEALWRA